MAFKRSSVRSRPAPPGKNQHSAMSDNPHGGFVLDKRPNLEFSLTEGSGVKYAEAPGKNRFFINLKTVLSLSDFFGTCSRHLC